MFGSGSSGTGFGGFGQNNQNPTGTGSVFGGGGGFGTTTNTGFGAAANTGFGPKPTFGTAAPATGTGLFGNTPAAATTGFGGFGTNTAAPGGFGNANATTTPAATGGLYGKPFGTATSTAGTTGGLFNTAGPTNTAFGAGNPIGFGNAAATTAPLSGTSNPVFIATQEKDPAGTSMNHFQTISFMPAYQKFSLEELRLQDYLQGRRYGNESGTGAFAQNTGFGAGFGATQQPSTGFGNTPAPAGGLFSAAQPSAQTGFGTTGTGFGTTPAANTGLFGNAPKPATSGLFGTTPAASTAGSLFGQTGSTGFGATGTSGGFGTTPAQPAAPGGLFGNTAGQQSNLTNTFGQQQNTGFGNTQTPGGGLFGGSQGAATTPFGAANPQQQQQQAQQPAAGTGFGTGFGQTPQQNPAQSTFGTGFGTQQPAAKPFGTGFGTTQPAATGSTLFGNAQQPQQQQQQQPANSLFAAKPTFNTGTTTTTGGGLFGNPQSTTGTTGGLFGGAGSAPAAGGLFGSTPQSTQQSQSGGLFGNKPATGGLFGNTATTGAPSGGGMFNSFGSGQAQQGAYGSNQQPQNNLGQSGFFNNSMAGGQQGQQSLGFSSSINDPNPYGANPLLAGSIQGAPGPIATPIGSVQKKKSAMLPQNKIAPRAAQITPRLGASFSRNSSPFAASSSGASTLSTSGNLGRSLSSSSKLHLFDSDDSVLSAGAFTPSASNRVASLKRLVIDRNIRDADLFTGGADLKGQVGSRDDGKPKGILKKVVSFDSPSSSRRDADLFGKEDNANGNGRQFQTSPSAADDMGYLRSSGGRKSNQATEKETSTSNTTHDQQSAQGKEVALVPSNESTEPVNDHGRYWMSPSLAMLKSMPKEKLKRVTDLTVGRKGFGQVRFETAVDLTNTNPEDIMDGIVVFSHRICTVYPEHLPKPPPGAGLNVPSTINLEDCFPQYRDTRGPVKDPQHPRYIAHLNRLKSVKDTEFVDYVAAEGIWIFKVKHFTTYGLVDDDDEEQMEEHEGGTPRPVEYFDESSLLSSDQSFSAEGEADSSGLVSDDSSAVDDTFDFKRLPSLRSSVQSEYRGTLPGDLSYEEEGTADEDTTLGAQDDSFLGNGSVGSVEEEDEDEEDLDDEEDDEPAEPDFDESIDDSVVIGSGAASPDVPTTPVLSPTKQLRPPTPVGTPSLPVARNWTEQLNLTISPVKRRKDMDLMSPMKSKFELSPTKKGGKGLKSGSMNYGHLDLVNDLLSGGDIGSPNAGWGKVKGSPRKGPYQESPQQYRNKAPTISEADCNRIVRPLWNAEGKLLYIGELVDSTKRGKPQYPKSSKLRSTQLRFAPKNIDANAEDLSHLLELQYISTDITKDVYGIPFAELRYSTLFETFADIPWGDNEHSRYEKSVWRLASVLFDPLEESPPSHIHPRYYDDKMRKERLSRFLEELVEKDADYHARIAPTSEEAAFAYLTGHRVEQACAALLDGNAFRLATLLAMIGGDRNLRQDMGEQITDWRNHGTLAEMALPIRALYELLAGNTCLSKGLKKPYEDAAADFFFSQQFKLDWKRTFGLKLWYGTTEDQSVADAINLYENDFKDYPRDVQRPTPWYVRDNTQSNELDILWGLLKIVSSEEVKLEDILSARWADSEYLDYRLPWQLRGLMSRRGIRDFTPEDTELQEKCMPKPAEQLTFNYAAQLEAQGRWEWAAFILIHVNDPDKRELSIRNILGRHVEDLEDDGSAKFVFIRDKLLIPMTWIFEAKALHARQFQLHIAEAEFLLAAQAWGEAHRTIVQQVAPKAVIAGDLEKLSLVLSKFDDVNKISDWSLGGQVYLDYITLVAIKEDLPGALALAAAAASNPSVEEKPRRRGDTKAFATSTKNDVFQLCKRLLGALPNMERWNFEQKVAIAEMGAVVSGVVLKAGAFMANEAPKILSLPLMEDQYLKRTVSLSLEYYKAKLVEAR
ncbi:nuclear protein 96-domain-containing protein [Peziza echinospora]|nr:nuclear protein 96-domain-containing protein [Peziza echinospora]